MKNIKNVCLALCAITLLSGCAGNKKRANSHCGVQSIEDTISINEMFSNEVEDKILFGLNKYNISPEAMEIVKKQAQWLNEHQDVRLIVEGHCDERGTKEYNMALGEKRAYSMKKALEYNGIEPGRIDIVSYGKERPAVIGYTESDHAQNRRAVVVLQ